PPLRPPLFPYTTLFRSRPPVDGPTSPRTMCREIRLPPPSFRRPPHAHTAHTAHAMCKPVGLPVKSRASRRCASCAVRYGSPDRLDRKSTRLNSSHLGIS